MTTLVILGTGMILGFRFHRGTGGGIAVAGRSGDLRCGVRGDGHHGRAVLVQSRYGGGSSAGHHSRDLFCTGLVPVDKYPDWVQPLVRYQPMSLPVDAMRGLSVGGPVLPPMLTTLAWCGAIFVMCLWPIMVGYRRASTSR